ncbi:MAG: hypothetical protein V4636_16405 [Pseudomonadota bacterium]
MASFFSFASPVTSHASAATWRCGNTYTDHPCEGGKSVSMDDRRDGPQQRDADAAARSAQSAADRMAQQRLQLEQSTAGHQAVLIARPPETATPKKIAEPKSKVRGKKQRTASDHFTAQGPGTGIKKKVEKASGPEKP